MVKSYGGRLRPERCRGGLPSEQDGPQCCCNFFVGESDPRTADLHVSRSAAVAAADAELEQRIGELEAENARLKEMPSGGS